MREPSPPLGLLTPRRRLLLGSLLLFALLFAALLYQSGAARGVTFGERVGSAWQRLANAVRGPVRVGVQVGHLNAAEHPDELANLRLSTGGRWAGVNEVDLNLTVAERLAGALEALGIKVDLLGATLPPNYRADLLVSLHADASPDPGRRGYKSAYFTTPEQPGGRNTLEPLLKRFIDEAYFYYSGLPDDDRNVSGDMLQYYAFNDRRFKYSAARKTPALIVEMGYLSSPADMAFLRDPGSPAYALKQGIVAYLAAQGRLPQELAAR